MLPAQTAAPSRATIREKSSQTIRAPPPPQSLGERRYPLRQNASNLPPHRPSAPCTRAPLHAVHHWHRTPPAAHRMSPPSVAGPSVRYRPASPPAAPCNDPETHAMSANRRPPPHNFRCRACSPPTRAPSAPAPPPEPPPGSLHTSAPAPLPWAACYPPPGRHPRWRLPAP